MQLNNIQSKRDKQVLQILSGRYLRISVWKDHYKLALRSHRNPSMVLPKKDKTAAEREVQNLQLAINQDI